MMRSVVASLLLCLFGNGLVAEESCAYPAGTTLKEITLRAHAIVVARVETVEQNDGVRMAVATVNRALKGVEVSQRFAFLAEGAMEDDLATAIPGETVLLFLRRPPGRETFRKFPDFPRRHPNSYRMLMARPTGDWHGLPFYHIRTRMPIETSEGRNVIRIQRSTATRSGTGVELWSDDVQLPSNLRATPISGASVGGDNCWVPLQELETAIKRYLTIKQPARRPPVATRR